MRKSLLCLTLALALLCSGSLALASTMPDYAYVYATLNQRLSSRTGPGTRYDDDAMTLNSVNAGTSLRVLSKAYDRPNSRWWVQVEFTYRSVQYRVYTGEQRFYDLNLYSIPEEYELGSCKSTDWGISECYAGPGMSFAPMKSIPANTACTIWGYEENYYEDTDYLMVEYYDNYARCYRRCWVKEWAVDDEYMYYGWPNSGYTGSTSSSSSSSSSYSSSSSSSSSYSSSSSSSSSSQYGWPLGTICRVRSTSGRVRTGPGTGYSEAGYVNQGEEYEILEVRMGDTGKDWYKVRGKNFGTAWLSSGIVSVWYNGTRYDYGTANGWPISP